MNYQFTIVVPVYNEEDNLKRVEQELTLYTQKAIKKTKITMAINVTTKDNKGIISGEILNALPKYSAE